jgi:hypothetical protein
MSSQRLEPDLLSGGMTDENTLISDRWLELLVAREHQAPPQPDPHWGTLPAKALELSQKVESLRTRQEKLRQDLDRILDEISHNSAKLPPPVVQVSPEVAPIVPAPRESAGSGSFLMGIARKIFIGKGIRQ